MSKNALEHMQRVLSMSSERLSFSINFRKKPVEMIPWLWLLFSILAYCFIILSSQGRRIKAVASVLYESSCLGISSKMKWGNKTSLYVTFCSCYVLMICIFLNFKFFRKYISICLRYHLIKLKKNSQEENRVLLFMAAFVFSEVI